MCISKQQHQALSLGLLWGPNLYWLLHHPTFPTVSLCSGEGVINGEACLEMGGKLEWRGMLILAFSIFVLLEFFFMDNLFN